MIYNKEQDLKDVNLRIKTIEVVANEFDLDDEKKQKLASLREECENIRREFESFYEAKGEMIKESYNIDKSLFKLNIQWNNNGTIHNVFTNDFRNNEIVNKIRLIEYVQKYVEDRAIRENLNTILDEYRNIDREVEIKFSKLTDRIKAIDSSMCGLFNSSIEDYTPDIIKTNIERSTVKRDILDEIIKANKNLSKEEFDFLAEKKNEYGIIINFMQKRSEELSISNSYDRSKKNRLLNAYSYEMFRMKYTDEICRTYIENFDKEVEKRLRIINIRKYNIIQSQLEEYTGNIALIKKYFDENINKYEKIITTENPTDRMKYYLNVLKNQNVEKQKEMQDEVDAINGVISQINYAKSNNAHIFRQEIVDEYDAIRHGYKFRLAQAFKDAIKNGYNFDVSKVYGVEYPDANKMWQEIKCVNGNIDEINRLKENLHNEIYNEEKQREQEYLYSLIDFKNEGLKRAICSNEVEEQIKQINKTLRINYLMQKLNNSPLLDRTLGMALMQGTAGANTFDERRKIICNNNPEVEEELNKFKVLLGARAQQISIDNALAEYPDIRSFEAKCRATEYILRRAYSKVNKREDFSEEIKEIFSTYPEIAPILKKELENCRFIYLALDVIGSRKDIVEMIDTNPEKIAPTLKEELEEKCSKETQLFSQIQDYNDNLQNDIVNVLIKQRNMLNYIQTQHCINQIDILQDILENKNKRPWEREQAEYADKTEFFTIGSPASPGSLPALGSPALNPDDITTPMCPASFFAMQSYEQENGLKRPLDSQITDSQFYQKRMRLNS